MGRSGSFRGVCLGVTTLAALAGSVAGQIPWDEARWQVQAQESRVEEYLGREALYMRGGNAWLRDTEFRDGTIEFDISATAGTGFNGVRFRAVDRFNHEHVYLRPHLSGRPDAVQYNPIYNGVSSWQLYSDARYVLPVVITPDRWVHVRMVVQGRRMEMSVDGELLVFPHLARDPASGEVAINASGPGGAYFSNFVIRPGVDPDFRGGDGAATVEPEPGTVSEWRISAAFPEAEVDGVVELSSNAQSNQSWTALSTDVRGIVNLARLGGTRDGNNTVFAAVTLTSDRARTVRVRLGFSDRVRAFLNGKQLFRAGDEFASRDYRFLGTMGLFDELFLSLEAGDNELWLAISETFGGWGVMLQVPDGPGVQVR